MVWHQRGKLQMQPPNPKRQKARNSNFGFRICDFGLKIGCSERNPESKIQNPKSDSVPCPLPPVVERLRTNVVLLAQAQFLDRRLVGLRLGLGEVSQKAVALADHHHQTPPVGMILEMGAQVL